MPAPTTLLMPRGMWGGALPCLSSMGVDGAHNTVGEISAPTTLLGFCHAREVAGYHPAGAQGTVLGIAVDLSVLLYLPRPLPGPHRACVPGRLVLVGSDCASRRRAASRGSVHPRSETWVGVGSGVWPGLPVGEVGWSRKRALFLLGQAFRSERRAGVGSEHRSSPWPGLPVGDRPSGLSFRYLGRPRSCALFATSSAEPSFCREAGP